MFRVMLISIGFSGASMRTVGALVAFETGEATSYALNGAQDRGHGRPPVLFSFKNDFRTDEGRNEAFAEYRL